MSFISTYGGFIGRKRSLVLYFGSRYERGQEEKESPVVIGARVIRRRHGEVWLAWGARCDVGVALDDVAVLGLSRFPEGDDGGCYR